MPDLTVSTTVRVTYILDDQVPGYGAVWEVIGRGAPAFHLTGNRGESGTVSCRVWFATESEALEYLEELDRIRDGGFPFELVDGDEARRYEFFLHAHNDPVPYLCHTSDGDEFMLRLQLQVTRLSTVRK